MIDITMRIAPGMAIWPGDEPPRQGWNERIADGGDADVSHWVLGSHTGTHVDAPSHFLPGGQGIDELELSRVVGACEVVDVDDDRGLVTGRCLQAAWPASPNCRRLLLRTRNSREPGRRGSFDRDFIALDVSAVQMLNEWGVETIGVDYLSVERFVDARTEPDYDYPVHRALLQAGVTIIEGLDLSRVSPGAYHLSCLPLPLVGSEAAPARAVLTSCRVGRPQPTDDKGE
jgi:arylformamidase